MPFTLEPLTQEELDIDFAPKKRGELSADILAEYVTLLGALEIGQGRKIRTISKPVEVTVKGVKKTEAHAFMAEEPELSLRSFKRRLNAAAAVKNFAVEWKEKTGSVSVKLTAKKAEKPKSTAPTTPPTPPTPAQTQAANAQARAPQSAPQNAPRQPATAGKPA